MNNEKSLEVTLAGLFSRIGAEMRIQPRGRPSAKGSAASAHDQAERDAETREITPYLDAFGRL